MRNAHQIMDVIYAAFGSHILETGPADGCTGPQTGYHELACEWQGVSEGAASVTTADKIDPAWVISVTKVSATERTGFESKP
jgi:hypothetical protein